MIIHNGVTGTGVKGGNPFGHSAIAFTGTGVYSYGNSTDLGSSLTEYIKREIPRRNTWFYIIKTTPEEEKKMLEHLKKFGPNRDGVERFPDNCAQRTSSALEAGGMPYPDILPTTRWPRGVEFQAKHWMNKKGGQEIYIPKDSNNIPAIFYQFNSYGDFNL